MGKPHKNFEIPIQCPLIHFCTLPQSLHHLLVNSLLAVFWILQDLMRSVKSDDKLLLPAFTRERCVFLTGQSLVEGWFSSLESLLGEEVHLHWCWRVCIELSWMASLIWSYSTFWCSQSEGSPLSLLVVLMMCNSSFCSSLCVATVVWYSVILSRRAAMVIFMLLGNLCAIWAPEALSRSWVGC